MIYDATLANSFDGEYEMLYGSDSAIMMRDNKAWLFKEVDSPLFGWELYARKEIFYQETGIACIAGASKLQQVKKDETPLTPPKATLSAALETFLRNASDVDTYVAGSAELFKDDPAGLKEGIATVPRRTAAGYLDGFQATVMAIKANEAVVGNKRIELKKEWFELG
jgi:hypothetical protein